MSTWILQAPLPDFKNEGHDMHDICIFHYFVKHEAMYAKQRAHESFTISLQRRSFKNESSVQQLETKSNAEV